MKLIISYLIGFLILLTVSLLLMIFKIIQYPPLYIIETPIYCVLSGGFGGLLYLFRAVYVNKCVKNKWDQNWETWYFIRPLTSMISGGVTYLFLSAGLLILSSEKVILHNNFGFFAFSFIAGLNVDNFVKKIEEIAEITFGIKKSRMAKGEKENENNENNNIK